MTFFLLRETVRSMHPPGESIIAFKAAVSREDDAFTGSLTSYDEMSIWATERCIPLVREITFQVSPCSVSFIRPYCFEVCFSDFKML